MNEIEKILDKFDMCFNSVKYPLYIGTPDGEAKTVVVEKIDAKKQTVKDWLKDQLIKYGQAVKDKAVLDYILSLGWQDTDNEYVKEVLADAESIAQSLTKESSNKDNQ